MSHWHHANCHIFIDILSKLNLRPSNINIWWYAGRRYQLVFRRANILPDSLSRVMFTFNIKTYNKSFCAKLVLLQLNVAPVPGIALGWVWRLGPRAVQPADGGLLPPDVGGALGEGERFDPVGHSSAEQQTNAAPLPRRLSGSLPQQYCGRCTLVKITPISTRPWRGDERKYRRSQNQQIFLS